ncbi:hypothetical protein HZB74_01665 [Candidatus Saccharibacteria bacterium]|nr:hypothetical protein [Candidatus Saccharibacteria bacterium]
MTEKIKIGLLGKGRTGSKVIEVYGAENIIAFDQENPPTLEKLKQADVLISFLPGEAIFEYIDVIIESKVPLASGGTGFVWPSDINDRLKKNGITWITSSNFAIGMSLVKAMVEQLSKADVLFDETEYKLHEIHHIYKKDHPSGTGLTMEKWLGHKVSFSHERDGDNPGEHKLTLVTPYEEISIEHKSLDRKIFANGAIWAAKRLLRGDLKPGLHELSDLTAKEIGL